MNTTAHFSVKNLVKLYDKNKVLDVAELNIRSGQFLVLMGKNGSGKSTLMRLLAQQELFDDGDINYNGKSLLSTSVRLNPQTVFISEEQVLPFSVPLSYWVDINQHLYPKFDLKIFERLCKSLEIDATKNFHGMSRGQKMKALFCLQAPKKPEIYILDEITSVLDASSRWAMMEFLGEEVQRGGLVVMSTNIASEMQGFATHVTFLEKGTVTFQCDVGTLEKHFRKIKVPKNVPTTVFANASARRIGLNGDETWSYLMPQGSTGNIDGAVDDQREITIADVQAYFTAGEVGT